MGWVIGVIIAIFVVEVAVRAPFIRVCLGFVENIPNFGVEPATPDPNAERIEFPTSHGLTLRGSLYQPRSHVPDEPASSRGLVLFCPEYGGNHWMAMQYCQALWDVGFTVLSFDFRSQGDSDTLEKYKPIHWLTQYEVTDASAAMQFIEQHDELSQLELGVFGISRGGSAALAIAALEKRVKCVVTDSAFSADSMMIYHSKRWAPLVVPAWLLRLVPDFHIHSTLKIVQWVSRFKSGYKYFILEKVLPKLRSKPVFLISGKRDTYVPPVITDKMRKRVGGDRVETWIVKKAKHNMARSVLTEEYDEKLVGFFARHLSVEKTPASTTAEPVE